MTVISALWGYTTPALPRPVPLCTVLPYSTSATYLLSFSHNLYLIDTLYTILSHPQVASKFTHQMSLLSGRSVERALEDALVKNKNASKFTEVSFQDAIFSLGLVLSGCACRSVFAVLDPEGKGTVTVDSIIDYISKGKAGHERRDRDGTRYVNNPLCIT